MDSKTRTRLETTLEAARLIREWDTTEPYEQASSNVMLISAYQWQLERIGGTLRLAKDVIPDIQHLVRGANEWIALGDHILHDYRDLQEERIRTAITDGIPLLMSDLEKVLHH